VLCAVEDSTELIASVESESACFVCIRKPWVPLLEFLVVLHRAHSSLFAEHWWRDVRLQVTWKDRREDCRVFVGNRGATGMDSCFLAPMDVQADGVAKRLGRGGAAVPRRSWRG
jgi:hypothetical protein